jgi:hypothetical protein
VYSLKLYILHFTVDELMDNLDETRRRSAALFGNEKAVEVIAALDEEGSATAQTIAVRTGITYSLVRDALLRLTAGRAIQPLPRLGGSRSPQYYQPVNGDLWTALTAAAQAIMTPERSRLNLPALTSARPLMAHSARTLGESQRKSGCPTYRPAAYRAGKGRNSEHAVERPTHPPRLCYSYFMISPNRGNFTDPGVQVPLGHVKSP